jgi:hypothetical protein
MAGGDGYGVLDAEEGVGRVVSPRYGVSCRWDSGGSRSLYNSVYVRVCQYPCASVMYVSVMLLALYIMPR